MHGLYAIVDVGAVCAKNLDPLAFARAVLSAHPAALQVRAKDLSTRELLSLLRRVAPLCREARVPLVANDRVDIAVLAGCDYVHLGQEDLPPPLARRIAPGLRVGVSTHTLDQLDRALEARPDYVAYGPIFPTASKQHPDPVVGVSGLKEAAARAVAAGVPFVAIGGITLEHAEEVARYASTAAVIGALLPQGLAPVADVALGEVVARARQLHDVFHGSAAGVALA